MAQARVASPQTAGESNRPSRLRFERINVLKHYLHKSGAS